jgi:hypothetical protein
MEKRPRHDENPAFWLAPLASTIPLIPFFSLPSSPLFLGKLMGNPAHLFLWPHLGPWLAAMAVVFDGTLLAYLMAVPVFLLLQATGKPSVIRVLVVFSLGACWHRNWCTRWKPFGSRACGNSRFRGYPHFSDAFAAWFPAHASRC